MPEKITRHELIGLKVEITNSANSSLKGIKGKIIDETKNTITIETKNNHKKIIKSQVKMKINNKEIDGTDLVGRPEERIKK
ncbi:MAG: ribonuclease P protein subunit [Nanoarchaeota archaeon]